MPTASGTVTAAPVTSDTWLYQQEPATNHGFGSATAGDLYLQRSAIGATARIVLQWDLSATVDPTVRATTVVTGSSISLTDSDGSGSGTIELRFYNQNTSVEAATWNDGLRDGQVSPPAATWTFTAGIGAQTIPNSAELDALIQEGIRNHGSVITLVLQYTGDIGAPAATANFAPLEDAAQEAQLSFSWSVPGVDTGTTNATTSGPVRRHGGMRARPTVMGTAFLLGGGIPK